MTGIKRLGMVLVVGMLGVACSGEAGHSQAGSADLTDPADGGVNLKPQSPSVTGCTEGYVTECTIELPAHNGQKNCATGLKSCHNGVWGPCEDPSTMNTEGLANWNKASHTISLARKEDAQFWGALGSSLLVAAFLATGWRLGRYRRVPPGNPRPPRWSMLPPGARPPGK